MARAWAQSLGTWALAWARPLELSSAFSTAAAWALRGVLDGDVAQAVNARGVDKDELLGRLSVRAPTQLVGSGRGGRAEADLALFHAEGQVWCLFRAKACSRRAPSRPAPLEDEEA